MKSSMEIEPTREETETGITEKRPMKATQAATVNQENKDSENMKKLIEILANKFVVLMEKTQNCTEIVPEEILDEIPKFHQVIGAIGTLGFALEEIDKLFPLSEYLPEEKADKIKEIIFSVGSDNDDSDEEERCYDEIN